MELAISITSTAITIAALVYAILTNREKRNLERLVQSALAAIAGEIALIRNNPKLAHKNLEYAIKNFGTINTAQGQQRVLAHLTWAQGDSCAAHRMLEAALLNVLAIQDGLFGTRNISAKSKTPTSD